MGRINNTKAFISTLLLLFVVSFSKGQVQFEKGYFINNDNERTACFIKNYQWWSCPTEMEYKIEQDDSLRKTTIENIKEFGVAGHLKYVRENVKIDMANENEHESGFAPRWTEKTLFLNVIIEGEASLYSYTDKNNKFYFFETASNPIEQLIFGEIKLSDNEVFVNNGFRQQLLRYVNSEHIPDWKILRINYNRKELGRHFIRYNTAQNSMYEKYEDNNKTKRIHLKLAPGIHYSSLSISTENSVVARPKENADFNAEIGFRMGAEMEIILSPAKEKWSLVFEPNFQQYKTEKELVTQSASVDYKSIELPLGIRHYFFLNNESRLYLNAFVVKDFSLNSKIDYERSSTDLILHTGFNAALGAGYSRKKLSAEVRMYTSRNLTNNYVLWDSKYNGIALIIGYQLF